MYAAIVKMDEQKMKAWEDYAHALCLLDAWKYAGVLAEEQLQDVTVGTLKLKL